MKKYIFLLSFGLLLSGIAAGVTKNDSKNDVSVKKESVPKITMEQNDHVFVITNYEFDAPAALIFDVPNFEHVVPAVIGRVINKPMRQLLGEKDHNYKSRCTYYSC